MLMEENAICSTQERLQQLYGFKTTAICSLIKNNGNIVSWTWRSPYQMALHQERQSLSQEIPGLGHMYKA